MTPDIFIISFRGARQAKRSAQQQAPAARCARHGAMICARSAAASTRSVLMLPRAMSRGAFREMRVADATITRCAPNVVIRRETRMSRERDARERRAQ